MNLEHDDLFATKHLHGNRSTGLELRQAFHILVDIVDGLTVNLLNDVAATDAGIMGRLASHYARRPGMVLAPITSGISPRVTLNLACFMVWVLGTLM